MFLGKNHGSHFITIKSAGKTHHPVPLRFAVNGSASARYASLPSTPATTKRRGGGARQNPAAPGAATASAPAPAPAPAHAPPAPPPFASTATSGARSSAAPHRPEPHGTEAVDRRGQNTAITTFRSPAQTKGYIPGRNVFEAHFGQTKARPLNETPPKRTPIRRRATFLAKYRPDAFPKEPQAVKTPLRGKISPPCIQNELILARYALHVFKMPCKSPLKDTPSEDLAREGPFSLHGPLKSCTTGESCHAR